MTRPYPDVITRVSFATAYPALALMAATLMTGPWNVLLRKPNPISSDVRRDLGIWAGILAVLHTLVGQNVHLRGRPWLYYAYERTTQHWFPLRHDLFGFSNETGAISVLIVLALLATSNDIALRRLGTPRWKKLQRWNYVAFALAEAHAVAYQWNESNALVFRLLVIAAIAASLILQCAGVLSHRQGRRAASTRTFAR